MLGSSKTFMEIVGHPVFVFTLIILSVMVDWAFNINYLSILFVSTMIIPSVIVDCAFKTSYLPMLFVFVLIIISVMVD